MSRVVLAALAAAALLSGCSSDDSTPAADLVMSGRQFEPRSLTRTAGRQVTLQVANDDDERHNLSVPFVPVDLDFAPDEKRSVIFVAPASTGPVEFFCKYHREEGMQGTIQVTAQRGASGGV